MYCVIATISLIVRQFCLPNPFECFGSWAFAINCVAELFMHLLARKTVGLVYSSGECPAWGSFLYLLAYAAITGILALMGIFSFAWWWVTIIVATMIGIGILLVKLWGWASDKTW